MPIYDTSGGNGNNAWYHVVTFASVRIVAVNLTGNNKYVVVQPAINDDPTAIPEHEPAGPLAEWRLHLPASLALNRPRGGYDVPSPSHSRSSCSCRCPAPSTPSPTPRTWRTGSRRIGRSGHPSPDPNVTCPQVTTSMMPDAGDPTAILVFNVNYREAPTFYAGGLQVKIQNGPQPLTNARQGSAQLATDGEQITWTQRMSLSGGTLSYKVASGNSITWGSFGADDGDLAIGVATARASLATYDPDASASNSGPSFGSNRVRQMTLLRVRYYQAGVLLFTDPTPRPVTLSN